MPRSQSRKPPPSALGRLLLEEIDTQFRGNITLFAEAMGVSRQAVHDWLGHPNPSVPDLSHREAIAQALQVPREDIDLMIVTGLGYRVNRYIDPKTIGITVLGRELPADDVARVERDIKAIRRRNAELRKGRRG